jgi:2'-5' RNA ligase
MRLFVGVPLSDELRATAGATAEAWHPLAPTAKWVEPALFHLTLQFIGEFPDGRVPELAAALAVPAREKAPFTLRLGGPIVLPPSRRARVLALSVEEGFADLYSLAHAVMRATRPLGVPKEDRQFTAHLTLARSRREEYLPPALQPMALDEPVLPEMTVREFCLFQSVLRPGGPVYAARERLALGG